MMGRFTSRNRANWNALADRLDRVTEMVTEGDAHTRLHQAIALLEQDGVESRPRSIYRHPATGIPTREPLIQQMRTDGRGVLAIIRFLDFDRLCMFDPALGNQLLIGVASRLTAMLPHERLLCHVDRAHLAIWFGPEASEASASGELGAIEYALAEPLAIGSHTVVPTISSQLSRLDGEEPTNTIARALAHLSMSSGPTPGLHVADVGGRESFSLEQDLRLAMARGELRLCYQPLIDAAQAKVFGAEALMRWNSPTRGPVSPGVFIPVMEALGLANEAGIWALDTAVREASGWRAIGLGGLRVAVNVSGRQLERADLPASIDRTLRRHAQPPDSLEIELTESVAMVDSDRASQLFAAIRALGVGIAIDDFGTGFSSLSTLRKLSFDKIKIDREFVTEVDRRKESQAICQSVIALARGLGIRVLAEGVERPEEYAWLRQHGCDRFQGFYFSRPLEASAFVAFVEDRAGLEAKLAMDPRSLQRGLSERLSR